MARITVEDCLEHENNRFALVQLASKRTKQLLAGSRPLTTEAKGNKAVVTALREIAQGAVRFMTPEDEQIVREREERMKELGISSAQQTPSSPADDLFILPTNGSKEAHGVRIADADDDEEDDTDIEDIEVDDDLDDVDVDDADDADDSDDDDEDKDKVKDTDVKKVGEEDLDN